VVRVGRVVAAVGKSCASWLYNIILGFTLSPKPPTTLHLFDAEPTTGSVKSRIQGVLENLIQENLKGIEEAASLNMEFLPIVILAIMQVIDSNSY